MFFVDVVLFDVIHSEILKIEKRGKSNRNVLINLLTNLKAKNTENCENVHINHVIKILFFDTPDDLKKLIDFKLLRIKNIYSQTRL